MRVRGLLGFMGLAYGCASIDSMCLFKFSHLRPFLKPGERLRVCVCLWRQDPISILKVIYIENDVLLSKISASPGYNQTQTTETAHP